MSPLHFHPFSASECGYGLLNNAKSLLKTKVKNIKGSHLNFTKWNPRSLHQIFILWIATLSMYSKSINVLLICRSRWWGQSLSNALCSTALDPSHPLSIVGVSVNPPHQWLALASRDPRKASPTAETQSRAPAPRICKLLANLWPHYELQ